jgi:hypothetical protein
MEKVIAALKGEKASSAEADSGLQICKSLAENVGSV